MRLTRVAMIVALTLGALACTTFAPPPVVEAPPTAGDAVEAPVAANAAAAEATGNGAAAEPVPAVTELNGDGEAELGAEVAGELDELDPATLQSEALEQCQSAAEFLDRGDIDNALAALDRAYQLLLELPVDENGYLQVKEDLRLLVADLVVRAYASQRSVAAGAKTSFDLGIQIVANDHVTREIKSFTNGERANFLEAYRRSGLYRPMILAKLEAAGLPRQLSWLPLVESFFKVRALSRASALGMWQFISSTGLRYGLSRDKWVDERMDPAKSTDAAIAYLSELHGMFGDWPKALAGYNCGEARVHRLSTRNPNEFVDFWDLYEQLPQETRRYVPRFFATLLLVENPASYGLTLPEPDPPLPETTTVRLARAVALDKLDAALGLPSGTLAGLNPELRQKATPNRDYQLQVPLGHEETLLASVTAMPVYSPPTPEYGTHVVRNGDTLGRIASRYGTSVESIMRANNLRSANKIWPGQRLKVPGRGGAPAEPAGPTPAARSQGTHTVRSGESLYSIASTYHTTVAQLKADNGLESTDIVPGQKLTIHPGSRADLKRYTVKKGDTLGTIASRHGVRLASLLHTNGLTSRSVIHPGQLLVIPD